MAMIVQKFVKEIQEQLVPRKVTLHMTEPVVKWFIRRGFSPEYGARPLARLIQSEVTDVLAREILFGHMTRGGTASVTVQQNAEGEESLLFSYTESG